ncbi:MAG: hypothetical protein ABII23_08350 [bacterium]
MNDIKKHPAFLVTIRDISFIMMIIVSLIFIGFSLFKSTRLQTMLVTEPSASQGIPSISEVLKPKGYTKILSRSEMKIDYNKLTAGIEQGTLSSREAMFYNTIPEGTEALRDRGTK